MSKMGANVSAAKQSMMRSLVYTAEDDSNFCAMLTKGVASFLSLLPQRNALKLLQDASGKMRSCSLVKS